MQRHSKKSGRQLPGRQTRAWGLAFLLLETHHHENFSDALNCIQCISLSGNAAFPESPSPQPSPKGEGGAKVDLLHFCNARFAGRLTTVLPLPWSEGSSFRRRKRAKEPGRSCKKLDALNCIQRAEVLFAPDPLWSSLMNDGWQPGAAGCEANEIAR